MDRQRLRRPVPPIVVTSPAALVATARVQDEAEDLQLVRLRHGAYALVDRSLDGAERRRVLHHGICIVVDGRMTSRHAFCRESAAVIYGLRTWEVPDEAHVLAEARGSGNGPRDVRRHLGEFPESDVVMIDGIPVLSLPALAVDCARFLHPRDALVVVDHYLAVATGADVDESDRVEQQCRRVRAELMARIDQLPSGTRGARRARAVVRWATPWSESAWESHLRWALLTWGCRTVVCQVRLAVRGRKFRSDLAIPVGRRKDGSRIWLHIEYDGKDKYGRTFDRTYEAVHAERDRDLSGMANGDRILRFKAAGARDPARVVQRVQQALRGFGTVRLEPVIELMPPARSTRRRARVA